MPVKHLIPQTMAELPSALAELTPDSKIIGGGTDLIIRLHENDIQPDALLYVGHIPELKRIRQKDRQIIIGAAVTMAQIAGCPLLQGGLSAIIDAAADVGSEQIRNNATIGGNIVNASPAGDLIPILFLFDAEVEIVTAGGEHKVLPISDFVLAPGKTSLAYNEAVVGFIIDEPAAANYRSTFIKLGFREKVTISRIGLAMAITGEPKKSITDARIFVGAVSGRPIRLHQAEEVLKDKLLDSESIEHMSRVLAQMIMEKTPKEFDRDYKVMAARGIMEDLCQKIFS